MGTIARIKEYIDFKGITNKKFEESVGFSNGAFASQLKNNRTIGVDKLENILSTYSDINIEWLLTGIGSMLKSESGVTLLNTPPKGELTTYESPKQRIPLYEISASAGLTTLFSDQSTQIPLDYITIPNAPKCDGALSIRGDSMYPLLKAGDIVCYKTIHNVENIRKGEMYLLDIDDGDEQYLTVKYVQKSEIGKDHIKLVSENRYHDPMDIPIKNIRAVAIVKIAIRYNTLS